MTLYSSSSSSAQALNRFSRQAQSDERADREFVAGEAARLNVPVAALEWYLDCYGSDPVLVSRRGLLDWLPAYEVEIRLWHVGERLKIVTT